MVREIKKAIGSRKAFMKTLEVAIAVVMTFVFLTVFIPQYNTAQSRLQNEDVLSVLAKNAEFRACVISENISCINSSLSGALEKYDYAINISKSANDRVSGLPDKRVFSESVLIAGNSTLYEPRIVRIYYWGKG
ncbi:hypothetical protein HYV82_02370 [Candidatus Woesearchaeota archaeon]|nr:hypothetical protein [Candidatus Woesearchaeota archaeon]